MENTTFHESYHPLSQIEDFMREIADAYPQTASLINIGRSAEGRDIFALTISAEEIVEDYGERKKKKLGRQREKFGFVIQGAQHAREVC